MRLSGGDGDGFYPVSPDIFVWQCIGCGHRIMTHVDFHINDRPICVECNAEMEPVKEDPELGRLIEEAMERMRASVQEAAERLK